MLKRLYLLTIGLAIAICFALPFLKSDSKFPYTGSWVRYEQENQYNLEFTKEGKLLYRFKNAKHNYTVQMTYKMQGLRAIAVDKQTRIYLKAPQFSPNTTYKITSYFEITPDKNGEELKSALMNVTYLDEKTGVTTNKNHTDLTRIYRKVSTK